MGIGKLKKNERCPIHHSFYCCGRERPKKSFSKGRTHHGPVERIPDETTPRGYREVCAPAELKRRKDLKITAQDGACALCGEEFTDYREIELDHVEPRGMGAARRDDHWDNLQAVHKRCNFEKGSKRIESVVLPVEGQTERTNDVR